MHSDPSRDVHYARESRWLKGRRAGDSRQQLHDDTTEIEQLIKLHKHASSSPSLPSLVSRHASRCFLRCTFSTTADRVDTFLPPWRISIDSGLATLTRNAISGDEQSRICGNYHEHFRCALVSNTERHDGRRRNSREAKGEIARRAVLNMMTSQAYRTGMDFVQVLHLPLLCTPPRSPHHCYNSMTSSLSCRVGRSNSKQHLPRYSTSQQRFLQQTRWDSTHDPQCTP